MPNGKPGDHPVSDVVVHGLRGFSHDVDELIQEIHTLDGWGPIASRWIFRQQSRLWRLRADGADDDAEELIDDVRAMLAAERDHLLHRRS